MEKNQTFWFFGLGKTITQHTFKELGYKGRGPAIIGGRTLVNLVTHNRLCKQGNARFAKKKQLGPWGEKKTPANPPVKRSEGEAS